MISGLRNLKSNIAIFLDRIELYSKLIAIEAKIERSAIVRRLVWVGVGAIFALFALAMAHMAVLTFFWYTDYRTLAVIGVLLLDIIIAGVAIYIASRPPKEEAFAVTRHHLAEDLKFVKDTL